MKTTQEWWDEFRVRDTQVAIVTQPDIKRIQDEACYEGELAGLRKSREVVNQYGSPKEPEK